MPRSSSLDESPPKKSRRDDKHNSSKPLYSFERNVTPVKPEFAKSPLSSPLRAERVNKWYVVGTKLTVILGFCEHDWHRDHPAYTLPFEQRLLESTELSAKLRVTCVKKRVDPEDNHKLRQFPRYKVTGEINHEVPPLTQPIFVFVPQNASADTKENRAKWGRNLAACANSFVQPKYDHKFVGDLTPDEGPRSFLGDWLSTDDAMEIGRSTMGAMSTSSVLADDERLTAIFGPCRIQQVKEFYAASVVPQARASSDSGTSPEDSLQIADNLKLESIPM